MTPTLIIVPGLGDSGPQHWQTLWETKFGAARVGKMTGKTRRRRRGPARLQETIDATPGELCSGGPFLRRADHRSLGGAYGGHERVRGALLVAPTDAEQPGMLETDPGGVCQWPQCRCSPLPFPALVIASENDPYASRTGPGICQAWEAELVSAGEAGHINVASGHGEWPEGEILLGEALHAWTPPDIVRF